LLNHPDYPDYLKVLDFGIAKLIGPQGPNAVRNTMAGTVVGTPAYMSPEQCRPDSEHMNAAILRALEKDPAQRFGNMRELRDAIESAVRPPSQPSWVRPQTSPSTSGKSAR